eukprot:1912258-Heterocapsa_arctica.AAC.1
MQVVSNAPPSHMEGSTACRSTPMRAPTTSSMRTLSHMGLPPSSGTPQILSRTIWLNSCTT